MKLNFHEWKPYVFWRQSYQIFLVMQLVILLIIITCFQVNAAVYAQRVTLSENNVPIEKVFKQIKKQSGYLFPFPRAVGGWAGARQEDTRAPEAIRLPLSQTERSSERTQRGGRAGHQTSERLRVANYRLSPNNRRVARAIPPYRGISHRRGPTYPLEDGKRSWRQLSRARSAHLPPALCRSQVIGRRPRWLDSRSPPCE